jgi:hypothetical protein
MRLSPLTRVAAATLVAAATAAALVGCDSGKATTATTTQVPTTAAGPAGTLHQAALAMESASSYRFTGAVTAGGHSINLSGEFSAPDRLHETITVAGGAPVERIVIGTSAYQRSGTTWQAAPGTASASDPRSTFSALAQATTVSQQGSVYRFTLTGAAAGSLVSGPASGSVTGTASLANDRITDLTFASAGTGTTVHFIYTDVGSAPPVVAPHLTV